jgi:hypothetical protein
MRLLKLSLILTGVCFSLIACASEGEPPSAEGNTVASGGFAGSSNSAPTVSGSSSGGSASGSTEGGGTSHAGSPSGGSQSSTAGSSSAAGQGGSAGSGGTPSETGGASCAEGGAGGEPSAPAPIDYSIWSLQLPIGSGTSPTTISPSQLLAGFSNEYFYPAEDGGQIFMDPATGITTSGSQHCRTEMREMAPGGGGAAWPSTGTNTMTVTGKVLKVGGGSSGTVAVGQVFNGTDSIPLCELMYSTSAGGFKLLYEEAKGGGMTTDLKTPVALDERYEFELALNDGKLAVSINGKQVYTRTPSPAIAAKRFYFKVGNYDQTAKAGPISTVPYTTVEVYAVKVVHP